MSETVSKQTQQQDLNEKATMQEIQEQPIEYVVFSGGGAKGVIYSGVYEALKTSQTDTPADDRKPVLDGVLGVSGSSAGALAAAIAAFGVPPEKYKKISEDTDFSLYLGKAGIPGLPLMKGGAPLYELIEKTIRETATNFLQDKDFVKLSEARSEQVAEQLAELEQKKQTLLNRLENLQQQNVSSKRIADLNGAIKGLEFHAKDFEKQSKQLQDIIGSGAEECHELTQKCKQGDELLFKDLALLRVLDPVQFKDLLVPAVRKRDSTLQIFSAENTPNVPIAKACHASAALPMVLNPVTIDINGTKEEFIDGGYVDNIPTGYFPKNNLEKLDNPEKLNLAKKQGRVLALAFGNNIDDEANIAIYSAKKLESPSAVVQFLMNVVYKTLSGIGGYFKYTEGNEQTYKRLRDNALNTIILNTQGIGYC